MNIFYFKYIKSKMKLLFYIKYFQIYYHLEEQIKQEKQLKFFENFALIG